MLPHRRFVKWVVRNLPKKKKIIKKTEDIQQERENLNNIKQDSSKSPEQKQEAIQKSCEKVIDMVLPDVPQDILDILKEGRPVYDDNILKDGIKEWDNLDWACVFTLSAISISIMAGSSPRGMSKFHEKRTKSPRSIDNPNKFHRYMPGDQMPWKKAPGGSSKQFRIKGKHKIFPKQRDGTTLKNSMNHRYLYGHDWSKFWEMFQKVDWDKVEVQNVFGSKKLGFFVKQCWHMFYDTFSDFGVPRTGATWFWSLIIDDDELFKVLFTVHIEDILLKHGINGALFVYHRARNLMKKKEEGIQVGIKDVVQQLNHFSISQCSFVEYEMAIMVNAIILAMQVSPLSRFRGKINWKIVSSLSTNIVQYMCKQCKWKKEYEKKLGAALYDLMAYHSEFQP